MSIRILIVDDEADIPIGIKDFLEDESGYEIRLCFDAESGLKLLEYYTPDICIVDMRLPGMNGNEFILSASKKLLHCRFIVHTGSLDYIIPDELKRIGITKEFVFCKPVRDLVEFQKKIDKLMQS